MSGPFHAALPVLLSLVAPAAAEDAARIEPVPVATLARSIAIRHETFTLPNGLRVVVHTDHGAKTVGVQVDYAVGSTAEPAGKTGFAHLFEHLMFNGSENSPEDHSVPMLKLGATINGVTQFDRTAYANDVPTPGLEQTLFLESDRMGYLLGAINQTELDEQRGVVQNEKRMRDDRPLGTMRAPIQSRLYPPGHPYGHDIIGLMADIDAATLDDVRAFFRAHYGPNNAVLTLTGDIDLATAKRLVTRYFGQIPAGPRAKRPPTPVPTLPARADETVTDRVSQPYLYRAWAVPGITAPDAAALQVAAGTMAGADGPSLRATLVDRDRLFSTLSIGLEQYDSGGVFIIHGPVAAGIDPAVAGRALDAAIARAARTPPSPEAIERYLTGEFTQRINEAAMNGGGIGQVVNGMRMGQGPDWYRRWQAGLVAVTPASAAAAATRWLERPPYALTVLPGPPPVAAPVVVRPPQPANGPAPVVKGTRGPLPPEGTFTDLTFPTAGHATLRNGIEVVHLRNGGAPLSEIQIEFDAGSVADPVAAPGTQAMVLALLDKGTTSRDAAAIDRLRERMGAAIGFDADADRTTASLSVPTANLAPGLALLADELRHPAFAPDAVAGVRADLRAAAQADAADGGSLFEQVVRLRTDPASPYTRRAGPRDVAAIDRLAVPALRAFHDAWLRPDKATVFVVSDLPPEQVRAMLDDALGDWRATGPAGVKDRAGPPPAAPMPGIVLIDRPGSDQAAIVGGQAVAAIPPDTLLAAGVANSALAGDGMGRIARDLRETKGWTYSVAGQFDARALGTGYRLVAPVQQDKAGASLALMRDHLTGFVGPAPLTQGEFDAVIENRIRSMFVTFNGARSFMDAIRANRRLGRADDADATLPARYRAMTLDQARAAFRTVLDPARFVWVVSGGAAQVRPQLAPLGLPITVIGADGRPAG